MSGLRGRVILVTGASSGIGKATAEALGHHQATVVLAARSEDRLAKVAKQVEAAGGSALIVKTDVGDESQVQALIDTARKALGRIDVLVNNAGIGLYAPVGDITPEQMNRLLRTNYLGTFYCIRSVLSVMKQQGSGHIITVSSMAGRRGTPLSGGYCATKFAQVGLMDSLRRELQGSGIRTTVVFPGSTETEFFQNMENPSGYPIQRYGHVQTAPEVARAIVHAIYHPRAEVITQRFGRALVMLNAISPAFLDWVLRISFQRKN